LMSLIRLMSASAMQLARLVKPTVDGTYIVLQEVLKRISSQEPVMNM